MGARHGRGAASLSLCLSLKGTVSGQAGCWNLMGYEVVNTKLTTPTIGYRHPSSHCVVPPSGRFLAEELFAREGQRGRAPIGDSAWH